jgi:hypothetical protein
MSTEQQKPDLQLVKETTELSLAEIAEQALKETQEQREAAKQAEIERVAGLLARITAINNDIKAAVQIVGNAHPADRKAVKAKLEKHRKAKEDEKERILNDPGVQLKHIQELILELGNCNRWDKLAEIVEAAHSRGWFEELPINEKGNINYRALRFPDLKEPKLREACTKLRKAVFNALDRIVKQMEEIKAKKAEHKPSRVVRRNSRMS